MKKAFPLLVAVTILCAAWLTLNFANDHDSQTAPPPQKCSDPAATYRLSVTNDGKQRFANDVDGYFIDIPADYKVDMSHGDIVAVCQSDSIRLEIYKEPTDGQEATDIYINYSNRFMENTVDHRQTAPPGKRQFGENYAHITAWERDKATVIPKDYNHYVTADVPTTTAIYSFFFKSTEPLQEEDYSDILASFSCYPPTKEFTPAPGRGINVAKRGWNEETAAFYERYFAADAELTWGIFEPEFCFFHFDQYQNLEKQLDHEFPIVVWYNHIAAAPDESYWQDLLRRSYALGKVLELTLQTTATEPGNGDMIYAVLRGEYDDYLQAYARNIAAFSHPVLFRLGNEMNGDWCSYSAFQTGKDTLVFKEFYRYVYRLFEEAGATNVIWVWNPNSEDKPPFRWNHSLMYYPGDEYVDVVGMTAYNTGTYYSEIGETWQEFYPLYKKVYTDYDRRFGQPLMISEFACADQGGNKARWIADMFRDIRYFPKIKVAIWWNSCDYDSDGNVARSYVIDDSEAAFNAFRDGLHQEKNILRQK